MAPFAILHVCVGNICRSPMAERLLVLALRRHVGDRVDELYLSHGGGTGTWHLGEPMNPPAARQVRQRGGDPSGFRARHVDGAMVDSSDLILCATVDQVRYVLELRPSHDPNKTYGFAGVVVSLKDLSASIFTWYREDSGAWAVRKVIEIPAEPADPDLLPPALKPFGAVPPLVTDINLSLDDRFLVPLGLPSLPLDETFLDIPEIRQGMSEIALDVQLDDTQFTFEPTPVQGHVVPIFRYDHSLVCADNVFLAAVIEGATHQYPNGTNHPLVMADALWSFFSQYSLP